VNHKSTFVAGLVSLSAIIAICGTFVMSSLAEENGANPEERMRREPPPQAYEACQGKKEGDTVQFTTKRGREVTATCVNSPKGLFARPPHPPHDHEHEPGGAPMNN
jgi:hypothetical protein